MKLLLTTILLFFILTGCTSNSMERSDNPNVLVISAEDYQRAVYASWMGQIVGNTYGLCYEFKYIDHPGPDTFPYRFTWTLDSLRKYNGAFSDDDTDIEYMYLSQMEKHGIEPTYKQLSEAWKAQVKTKVWCANRQAVTLMHAGHYPPMTGSVQFNSQWCQIDPQLVNEIWAVTAPGMIRYAVDKSRFSARITNDSFGIEPTLHYAAMYSAAFFEKDLNKLIDIGTAALPFNSRFGRIVEEVKFLHEKYPNDWKTSRKIIKDKYFVYEEYNKNCWPVIDANLNGAFGIMGLLYGQGDFQKTLDFCCAFGMDADNQAATMCGLLAMVKGVECIPKELLFPLSDQGWKEPYNNSYRMITRPGLEDATITGIASRIATQGERVILSNGGTIKEINGKKMYMINTQAGFVAPFELNNIPFLAMEENVQFSYPLYAGGIADSVVWSCEGDLPVGLSLTDGAINGVPGKTGKFSFVLKAQYESNVKSITVQGIVHSRNLAYAAEKIVFNNAAKDHDLGCIRDGRADKTYYSIKSGSGRETDYYGYTWNSEQTISSLLFNVGAPKEYCGWFTSFDVEYLANGTWQKVKRISVFPEMNLENTQWLKPSMLDYQISFEPIKTKSIRIIGMSGGLPKDETNAHLGLQYYTAISELKVYEK